MIAEIPEKPKALAGKINALFKDVPSVSSSIPLLCSAFDKAAAPLLGSTDPAPYTLYNSVGKVNVLIVGDHAGEAIPHRLGSLGLSDEDRARHIAVDIGSRDIGMHLSDTLGAPAIFANYSRLVVDLNRGTGNPTQIAEMSDHTQVLGNKNLPESHKAQRLSEIFLPYHHAVRQVTNDFLQQERVPLLIFVHSFTPEMDNSKRPWHIGVLWNRNDDLSQRYTHQLRKDNPELLIGENQPYSLVNPLSGNTIERHAEARGLPHLVLEFRQDLVDTPEKARKMAEIALKSLIPLLDEPSAQTLSEEKPSLAATFDEAVYHPKFLNSMKNTLLKAQRQNLKPPAL
jgi:predicted N-formylglutamate amidohydrolase